MTDAERARALSLVTDKHGKYVLDDRVRRACPSSDHYAADPTVALACPCGGSGWLTTLVIEEPCPEKARYRLGHETLTDQPGSECKLCGGSSTITRPDTDRIIAVLEAAGYVVGRLQGWCEHGEDVDCWRLAVKTRFDSRRVAHDPAILVAACQALGIAIA